MTNRLVKLFIKNYEKTDDPRVRAAYGVLVSVTGIVLNLLLFAAKFLVGTLFASISAVADAVNNLSDAGSQIISLISFRIAAKPADREHPFGHARMEYVSAMIVSFLILHIGLDLLMESAKNIFSGTMPARSFVTVAVLACTIPVKLWLGLFNRKLGKRLDSAVMHANAADCISDVISTSAVLFSILILILFPNLNVNLDAYMGVIVAVMILVAGIKIFNETKNSILGEAPSRETVQRITDLVKNTPGVLGIHDLTVHNYGPGHTIAALHVEVDGSADIFETHDMIDNVEQTLRNEYGILATIHMDPIVTDNARVDILRGQVKAAVKRVDPSLEIHDFRFVEGTTHSNLIFDVMAPFELKLSDCEIKDAVKQQLLALGSHYRGVITVDRG